MTAVPTRSLSDVPAKEGRDQRRQASLWHLGLTPPPGSEPPSSWFQKDSSCVLPRTHSHTYTNTQRAWRFSPIPGAPAAGLAVDIGAALQLEHGLA